MKEEALLFGKTGPLVGIVTDPPKAERNNTLPAFILMNSGTIHRVGTNRLSVKLARGFAASGFVCLRYDSPGIGDSPAWNDNAPVMERLIRGTQEAMNYISASRGIDRFVLIGHCSGALMALKTASRDSRVVGAGLIGLPARKTLARYYWRLALNNPKTWLRIISGKTRYYFLIARMRYRLRTLLAREEDEIFVASNFETDLRVLTKRAVSVLIIYAEWDPGLDYFRVFLRNAIGDSNSDGKSRVEIVPGMNHSFGLLWGQERVIRIVHDWALQIVQEILRVDNVS